MKTIAVIGGGITGVTTAYALAKRGFSVTLLEKHRYAAMETSFANGGQLSASNAEVWNHWSTIVKGLKWMLKSDAPLLVNPKPSWHKLSWFAEFIGSIDLKKKGILHIYRDKAGFDHAAEVSRLLAEGGLPRRSVTPEEMRAIEPTLAGSYYGGYYTKCDSTGDIHKFTHGLATAIERLGVRCRYGADVKSVASDGKRASVILAGVGGDERLEFDGLVVCAGTASRALAAQLGDRVNIYPVKGYSITVNLTDEVSRASAPTVSLLDDETKLVSSRLGDDRFRVAGTAEFNGYNRDIRADRIRPLVEWVNQCFPGVNTRSVVPWAGLRPMMPNMMPKVGRGSSPCVFYNTGHGHLGWTLSAITADMVGDVVAQSLGRPAPVASGQTAVA